MHIPEGFLTGTVTVGTDCVAIGAVALALRGSRREISERSVPLAGLLAAAIFAARLVSVPIAAGTSVHLLGGVLAAILIGPYTALLCAIVILVVQSVVLGFGGISALGAGLIVMDLIPLLIGYPTYLLLRRFANNWRWQCFSAGVAAGCGVIAGGASFVALALWGTPTPLPTELILSAVGGSHALLACAEGALTAGAFAAVTRARPDLVRGLRTTMTPTPTKEPA